MDKRLRFFVMRVNGLDSALFVTAEEALEAIGDHLEICDEDTYAIEPVDGIFELIRRMGAFEDYDDEWMEVVLETTTGMVATAKKKRDDAKKKQAEFTADD